MQDSNGNPLNQLLVVHLESRYVDECLSASCRNEAAPQIVGMRHLDQATQTQDPVSMLQWQWGLLQLGYVHLHLHDLVRQSTIDQGNGKCTVTSDHKLSSAQLHLVQAVHC